MPFNSQRVEKSLGRRNKLSGGYQPPHLYLTEPLVMCWQRADSTETLQAFEDERSQDKLENCNEKHYEHTAEEKAWNLEVTQKTGYTLY